MLVSGLPVNEEETVSGSTNSFGRAKTNVYVPDVPVLAGQRYRFLGSPCI